MGLLDEIVDFAIDYAIYSIVVDYGIPIVGSALVIFSIIQIIKYARK